jgi:hypothetical protein
LRIELEQKTAIFDRQWRRAFLAKIDAHPAAVSGGNQKALWRPAMENKVERGRTEQESRDEDGKAKNCDENERGFAH